MHEQILSSTQLKTNLREVKEAAAKDVVYITENGVIAYAFMSLEIYDQLLERAQAEARWEVSANNVVSWAASELDKSGHREDGGLICTRAFDQSLLRPGIMLADSDKGRVIEYFSAMEHAGYDITSSIDEDHLGSRSFGDRVYKLYYQGSDIIYAKDSATGAILLCGLVPSIDRFEELVREGA